MGMQDTSPAKCLVGFCIHDDTCEVQVVSEASTENMGTRKEGESPYLFCLGRPLRERVA